MKQKQEKNQNQNQNRLFSTANLIKMALLSAIAFILMYFGGVKLPALFPSFLEIDLSEVPAFIAILTIHPWAGVVVVVIKNLLKALMGSTSGYVGEIANLLISIGYILPLTLVIRRGKDLKNVTVGIILGILGIAGMGAIVNYYITIPLYARIFMPMEAIIESGHVLNPAIVDVKTLVIYAITPFNLLKGTIVSVTSIAFIKAIYPSLKFLMPKKTH